MIKGLLKSIFSIEDEYRKEKKYKIISFFSKKIKFEVKNKIKNCVGIVDIAGIGDYMLQRQYFKYFKIAEKYKNCKFVYFIKKRYLNILNTYDSKVFDYVIPWDNSEETRKIINKFEFKTLINLNSLNKENKFKGANHRYNIIKTVRAKEKIADVIYDKEMYNNLEYKKNLKYYTRLIVTNNNTFESKRLKEFFEKLLEIKIPEENKHINPLIDFRKKNIAISMFTGAKDRNYIEKYWVEVINYLLSIIDENTDIIFLGGKKDSIPTQKIINKLQNNDKCKNLSGLLDISIIPTILAHCDLLISPETGTVHIAESVGCPVICLCCGGYYKRFQPYENGVIYVYPDAFENLIKQKDPILSDFYNRNNTFKMEEIPPSKIIQAIIQHQQSKQ